MTVFAFLLLTATTLAGTPVATVKPTTLTTSDGVTLQASLGAPVKASANGVVFVPMIGRSREDWVGVMGDCLKAGDFVLSFDLRGMGANVPVGTTAAPLVAADYLKMTEDVKAAVALLKTKGVTKITLVGAELGANLAANVAAEEPTVVDLVMLSPGMDYKGIISTDAVMRYGARPVFMVASKDDPYGYQSVARLSQIATGDQKVDIFDDAGKGTKMLNRQPELEGNIAGWVAAHWVVAAVTAPAVTPSLNVKTDKSEIETTGPTGFPQ